MNRRKFLTFLAAPFLKPLVQLSGQPKTHATVAEPGGGYTYAYTYYDDLVDHIKVYRAEVGQHYVSRIRTHI